MSAAAAPSWPTRACALAATSNTLPGPPGRGPVRRRRLPARDPGPVRALRRRPDRRRGLPPPRPARRRRRRCPTMRSTQRRRRRRLALDDFPDLIAHLARVHPSPLRRAARRHRAGAPRPTCTAADRPGGGAAVGGARRPALRPRRPGRGLRGAARPGVRRRHARAAATARSTSGRSPAWSPWPARAPASRSSAQAAHPSRSPGLGCVRATRHGSALRFGRRDVAGATPPRSLTGEGLRLRAPLDGSEGGCRGSVDGRAPRAGLAGGGEVGVRGGQG